MSYLNLAAKDGCHECGTWMSKDQGLCTQCQQVRTCARCAMLQHVRDRHSVVCAPVSFSITTPTGMLERVVSSRLGGLGAVHQYVTMKACLAPQTVGVVEAKMKEWAPLSQRLTVMSLLAGVIYNDFPGKDDADSDLSYVGQYLVPIAPNDAYYITDKRFLWQPSLDARWASAAVYKHVPEALMALAGIKHETMQDAAAMLERRIKEDRVNYHFLRASADERMHETQRRAINTARLWYRRAVEWRSLFIFGHIWHQMQDSFSPAHTRRNLARSERYPYGVVEEIYFFGNQTEGWHSRHESWDAVSQAGSEGAKRVEAAMAPLRDALQMFIRDVDAAPPLPLAWNWARMDRTFPVQGDHADRCATAFAEWLESKAYALAPASLL